MPKKQEVVYACYRLINSVMSAPNDLLEPALAAMKHAYAPYSHFSVGACLRASSGKLYAGCNVENASFSLTLCAESNAIGHMHTTGEHDITEILIVIAGEQLCPPCGACRQRLFEFAQPNTPIHLCTTTGKYQMLTIEQSLPFPFGSTLLETT